MPFRALLRDLKARHIQNKLVSSMSFHPLLLQCKRMSLSPLSCDPSWHYVLSVLPSNFSSCPGFYTGHNLSYLFVYTSQAFLKRFACPEPRTPILFACSQALVWGLYANIDTISKHYNPANLLPFRKYWQYHWILQVDLNIHAAFRLFFYWRTEQKAQGRHMSF